MSKNQIDSVFLYVYAKWLLRGSTFLLAYIILTGLLLFGCWPNGDNCIVLWFPFLPFNPLFYVMFWVSLIMMMISWPIVAYFESKMERLDV